MPAVPRRAKAQEVGAKKVRPPERWMVGSWVARRVVSSARERVLKRRGRRRRRVVWLGVGRRGEDIRWMRPFLAVRSLPCGRRWVTKEGWVLVWLGRRGGDGMAWVRGGFGCCLGG
jgi:hypothetical protein